MLDERSAHPGSISCRFSTDWQYSVHFTHNVFSPANRLLAEIARSAASRAGERTSTLFVVDAGLLVHHPKLLESLDAYCSTSDGVLKLAGEPVVVAGGEVAKNDPRHLHNVYAAIHAAKLCRHSCIIAVGGGAVVDLVGYAAATAHRGLRLIRIPTTVLAQADSAIGVKNSVNAMGRKNFLGTFSPPLAVINDCSFLTTLHDRDWRAGLAEAVKVALIKDGDFFDFLDRSAAALTDRNMPLMQHVIFRSAQLHIDHIANCGDPFETGSSRPLDFGHWAAHKLEQLTDYRLRHGEAVAIGIALDSTYSFLTGLLGHDDLSRILRLLRTLRFELDVPELHTPELLCGLEEFREHLGGRLTVMLLQSIGRGVEVNELDANTIKSAIAMLCDANR